MAKGQSFTPYQENIIRRYYDHLDSTTAHKLGEQVSDLYLALGTPKAEKLWGSIAQTLGKTGAGAAEVAKILEDRNIEALATMVNKVAGGKPGSASGAAGARPPVASSQPSAGATPAGSDGALSGEAAVNKNDPNSPDTLKLALKAFKKRLKLTRLDEESKLGRSPLTGSKTSVVAIVPPNQYPRVIWDELAKQGKIKYAGQGFYELIEGA